MQTLDFAEFHMKLKEDGINVSKPKLMDLLDRQVCLSYVFTSVGLHPKSYNDYLLLNYDCHNY